MLQRKNPAHLNKFFFNNKYTFCQYVTGGKRPWIGICCIHGSHSTHARLSILGFSILCDVTYSWSGQPICYCWSDHHRLLWHQNSQENKKRDFCWYITILCNMFSEWHYIYVLTPSTHTLFSSCLAILCSVFFVVSIPFVLGNGIYLFQLFDQFAATIPLLLVGFFEFIAVGWVCGVNRWVVIICFVMYHAWEC